MSTETEDFKALVERVRAIDPKAAEYMSEPHDDINEDRSASDLDCWAIWSLTPQGHFYWREIHKQLCDS